MSSITPVNQTDPPVYASPLIKKERLLFLDSTRGIALLGILIMNSMAQSQAHFFYDRMDLSQAITGPNFYAWVVEGLLFEGTMRGLFQFYSAPGPFCCWTDSQRKKAVLNRQIFFTGVCCGCWCLD